MNFNESLLCLVSPRFYPIIGGNENYFLNIANYISKYMETIVITGNIKRISQHFFEQSTYIQQKYGKIFNNVEVIRAKTLKNSIIRTLFYFNQYVNQKLEIVSDKLINPYLYSSAKNYNAKLLDVLAKGLLIQRYYANPNYYQIYHVLKKIHEMKRIDLIHSSPIYLTSNLFAYKFAKKKNTIYCQTSISH